MRCLRGMPDDDVLVGLARAVGCYGVAVATGVFLNYPSVLALT